MKTPEERAKEYADEQRKKDCIKEDCFTEVYQKVAEHWLAGYGADKWIRIEDELPPTFEYVIVKYPIGVTFNMFEGTINGKLDWKKIYLDSGGDITHWMPLPEGPK